MSQGNRRGHWTRREALAALAATATLPPLAAVAAEPALPPALARICVGATTSPQAARLGAAAAEGHAFSDLAASLTVRLGQGASADWRAALAGSGRRDIAAGDVVEVLDQPLMRTEAEVLAIGVLLRGDA